jgi:hypothetical protein
MRRLGIVAAVPIVAFAILACQGDAAPTVRVFIECDRTDSDTPTGEPQYDPAVSIYYALHHFSSGGGQEFVAVSKGVHHEDRYYQRERFYGTCRVLMGNSAKDASPSLPNSTHAFLECSDQPDTNFINANFDKAGDVERPLDFDLNYEEFDKFKTLDIQVTATTADFFYQWVTFRHCSARGPMIEEARGWE